MKTKRDRYMELSGRILTNRAKLKRRLRYKILMLEEELELLKTQLQVETDSIELYSMEIEKIPEIFFAKDEPLDPKFSAETKSVQTPTTTGGL